MAVDCPCPEGFTPDGNGNCVGFSSSAPTVNSTIYTGSAGSVNVAYGNLGTNFYPDITLLPFPITFKTGPNRFVDGSNNNLAAPFNQTGTIWGNSFTLGRLNSVGLWTGVIDSMGNSVPFAASPGIEWIGFSVCINVPTTTTYCIGIAGDNATRFKLDGALLFDSTNSGLTQWIFNFWNVFPITLTAGTHIITLEGINYGGAAAFGAEIYTASPAALAAMTTPAQLAAVTLFTTLNQRGQPFQTGLFSGYTCPDGCALNLCGQTPVCSCQTVVPPDPCCFYLRNCQTQQTIIGTAALGASIGQTVQLDVPYAGCWQVTGSAQCDNAVSVTVLNTFATCNACMQCFVLINCEDQSTISTDTDLSSYVGQIVQIQGYPKQCWTVTASTNCQNPAPVTIISSFSTCLDCLPKCYLLTDCDQAKGENPIITSTDLSQYVGQIIKIKGCVDTCWLVSLSNTCVGAEPVAVTTNFATCDLCNPPPIVPSPELLHQRKVRPGYNTPGCSPEYTEKVNCTFADQVYDQVKKRRYGISSCCERDWIRWKIKKKLLDLRAIWDPNLCKTCAPITCCTPCPIPEPPVPPTPESCPAPSNISAVIEIIPPPCDPPSGVSAQIIFNSKSTIGFQVPK